MTAANFGNGDTEDLAVGIPGDDLRQSENTGAVDVLYGSANGLAQTGRSVGSV